ncbi:protein TRI1 [Lipomyces oligophaga]|uniref:protein TRI1 n=1 Tax=Lipomyces oligophaga TaxID=45792 RepID=UPI0034CFF4C1
MPSAPPEPFNPQVYKNMVDAILSASNLEQITARRVRNGIQGIFDVDLSGYKKEIDTLVVQRFNALQDRLEQEKQQSAKSLVKNEDLHAMSKSGGPRKLSDEELTAKLHRELNSNPSRLAHESRSNKSKRKRATSSLADGEEKMRKINRNNPFNARMLLSPQLAQLLGETELSRPECVKALWSYIKEHNLQNPSDRREILCDDKMSPVFGDKVHMFTMNKVLAKHLYPKEDITGQAADDELIVSDELEAEEPYI